MVSLSFRIMHDIVKSSAVNIRLGNQLEEMERKHSLHCRWLPTDKEYKENEYALLLTKREQLLIQVWKTGQRRLFLIQLKRKYAGMFRIEPVFIKKSLYDFDCNGLSLAIIGTLKFHSYRWSENSQKSLSPDIKRD